MLSTAVLGIAYTLIQSAFAIFHVSMGNRIGGDGLVQIEFYGDKVGRYIYTNCFMINLRFIYVFGESECDL